jgi:signal transduction histidine kinase
MHGIENLVGEASIPVALELRGEPRRLPPVVGRGAYRVVRDALHAARSASVAIEFMPGALAVQIDAEGASEAATSPERSGGEALGRDRSEAVRDLHDVAELAAALGGGLRAVPRPGGFRVRAWLPTEGQPPCHAAPRAAR